MKWARKSPLRTNWHGFANKLLGPNEAEALKRTLEGGGNKECLETLLGKWYNTTVNHSWQMIVDALTEMPSAKKVLEKIKKECAAV